MAKDIIKYAHIRMSWEKENGLYRVWSAGKQYIETDNPLAAWNVFAGLLDGYMVRRIRKMLKEQGRNPWTGEEQDHGKEHVWDEA